MYDLETYELLDKILDRASMPIRRLIYREWNRVLVTYDIPKDKMEVNAPGCALYNGRGNNILIHLACIGSQEHFERVQAHEFGHALSWLMAEHDGGDFDETLLNMCISLQKMSGIVIRSSHISIEEIPAFAMESIVYQKSPRSYEYALHNMLWYNCIG
jgi:hypothetical protein